MVTTIVWLGLFSYVINKQREFQARYRSLISQSILKESNGISETELTGYLTQIEQSLKAIKFDTNRPDQIANAAREVKTQIDELIRPLSKRLWLDSIASYPKIRFTKVLVDSIIDLKVAIVPLAIIHLATAIINLASIITFAEATTRSLINLAVSLTLYFGLSKVRFNKPSIDFSFGIFKLALLAALPSLISEYFHSIVLFQNQSPITLFALLSLPVLMIGFSITRIIGNDRSYLIDAMKHELLAPNPNYQKTQVASYLHNSLQSELLALSRKLEAAAGSDDVDAHRASLEQLAALLNRSISEDFGNFYESPEQRLEQVIANWAGILEIRIINKEALFIDLTKSVIAVQLIEELASNANKHSTATELNFECSNTNGKLLLQLNLVDAFDLAKLKNFNFSFTQSQISNDSNSPTSTITFEIK
jgi:two-component sensor histidine kinase